MSRSFYRLVLCAFAARENGGTLNVMVKHGESVYTPSPALPQYSLGSKITLLVK
jgi:hypothetical protein